MDTARLYAIPGSHPCVSVELMLDRKGIGWRRTDLFPVVSRAVLRGLGFREGTVPAIKLDGRRVQGSREIARALDLSRPEPPLLPSDSELRSQVELAERFGDIDLQHPVRQILWWSLKREREAMASYAERARLGVPIGLAVKTGGPVVAAAARLNEADDENVRAALAALPGMLSRINSWIAEGVLGGEEPNAADFQIAPSIRLAMTLDDLRDLIGPTPAGQLAMRIAPDYPGRMPAVLPDAWLEPLRAQDGASEPAGRTD